MTLEQIWAYGAVTLGALTALAAIGYYVLAPKPEGVGLGLWYGFVIAWIWPFAVAMAAVAGGSILLSRLLRTVRRGAQLRIRGPQAPCVDLRTAYPVSRK